MSEKSDDIIHEIRMYTRLSGVVQGCLNELLRKTGYELTMSLPDEDELTTYCLKPLRQPPRCGPKCDHESGTHEASPPAPKVQTVVFCGGCAVVVEGPAKFAPVNADGDFFVTLDLPPGFTVKEIK